MPDSYLPRENLQHEKRTYRVHDNGGRPFEVTASYEAIIVKSLDTESSSDDLVYTKTVLEIKSFDGLWWGFDNGKRKFMRNEEPEHGSSILVKVTNKEYIFIGWKIQSFSTDETIIDYASPIGNSDVPYPVAYGRTICILCSNPSLPLDRCSISTRISTIIPMILSIFGTKLKTTT